jgi:hypothetical protein
MLRVSSDHRQSLESFILHARVLCDEDINSDRFTAVLFFLVNRCGEDCLEPSPVFVIKENAVSSLEIDRALQEMESEGLMGTSGSLSLSRRGLSLSRGGNITFKKRMHKLWRESFLPCSGTSRVMGDIATAAMVVWRFRQAMKAFNPETQNFIHAHLPPCPSLAFGT